MNTFSLSTFDTRLQIIIASVIGILTWHVPVPMLTAYATGILFLGYANSTHHTLGMRAVLTYAYFIFGWAGIKFALGCTPLLSGITPDFTAALITAGILALRLFILIGIGLLLASSNSPRKLGLALSWFMRPFLGKRSWEPALSLALMIHFIPLIQKTFSQVLQAMKLRNPSRSRWQRFILVLQAVLRICAQKTWTQTIAVAARKLDNAQAWQQNVPLAYNQIAIAILIISACFLPFISISI